MTETKCWRLNEDKTRMCHGLYKDELVVKDGKLMVWWKRDLTTKWVLVNPSELVIDGRVNFYEENELTQDT